MTSSFGKVSWNISALTWTNKTRLTCLLNRDDVIVTSEVTWLELKKTFSLLCVLFTFPYRHEVCWKLKWERKARIRDRDSNHWATDCLIIFDGICEQRDRALVVKSCFHFSCNINPENIFGFNFSFRIRQKPGFYMYIFFIFDVLVYEWTVQVDVSFVDSWWRHRQKIKINSM